MNPAALYSSRLRHPYHLFLFICTALIAAGFASSCGGGGSSSSSINPNKTTQVAVQLSSSANDTLTAFNVSLKNVTLTSASGTEVTVYSNPAGQNFEMMHTNGGAQPAFTAEVPQGSYVSAAITIGGSNFTCNTVEPDGTLLTAAFAYGYTPSSTVSVPSPIKIAGDSMGLDLDMLISKSYTMGSCYWPPTQPGMDPFSITPTFSLTPFALSPNPASPASGKAIGVGGAVSAVNSSTNSLTMTLFNGQSLAVHTGSGTVYQQVSGLSSLTGGSMLEADLATQPDGSQLATRIAVLDPDPAAVSVARGPVLKAFASDQVLYTSGREQQGPLEMGMTAPVSYGNAMFQVSGIYGNLAALPFAPMFSGSNVVTGQNVYVSTHASTFSPEPIYVPAATVTLMPQTLNGTVQSVSTSGGFTVYTVVLASYDLFPALASQPGEANPIANPNTVTVYTDSNTQMLNTQALAAGSVVRFTGLVFNDNGVLRMDCGQVNDGVAE